MRRSRSRSPITPASPRTGRRRTTWGLISGRRANRPRRLRRLLRAPRDRRRRTPIAGMAHMRPAGTGGRMRSFACADASDLRGKGNERGAHARGIAGRRAPHSRAVGGVCAGARVTRLPRRRHAGCLAGRQSLFHLTAARRIHPLGSALFTRLSVRPVTQPWRERKFALWRALFCDEDHRQDRTKPGIRLDRSVLTLFTSARSVASPPFGARGFVVGNA